MRLTLAAVFSFLTVIGISQLGSLTKNLQQEVNHLRQDISRYEAMRSECAPAEDSEP